MEHRAYLPSLGIFLALVAGAERLLSRRAGAAARLAGPALVALAWLGCAALLHARNAVWETPQALWRDAIQKVPGNGRAYANLAAALETDGRFAEEAEVVSLGLARAEGLQPGLASRMYAILGGALTHLGRLEEAERALARGTALFPFDGILIENRAINLLELRRYAEAEAVVRPLTGGHAPEPAALAVLGRIRLAQGDAAGALRLLEQSIALDPDPATPHLHRARAIAALGRREEGCAHLVLVALRKNPALVDELNRAAAEMRCGPPPR